MAEKQNTPEIRFEGFTDPWEQRKFSDLVLIERGGSPRPIDAYITEDPAGLNWVKIGDAPSMGRYITTTSEKIKPEGLSKTRQVYPGDLVLSNSMSFGRPYIMAVEGCIHDGWLLIRDTQNQFDPVFLCHMLGTPQMLDQYRMFASGSTVNNLNKELVGNAMVPLPDRDEQVKIGNYLDELDGLITLHQRKCQYRGLYGYLSWEQRKLGELIQLGGSGGTPSANNPDYYGGDIPFLSIADINGRDITNTAKTLTDEGLQNSAAWIVPSGAVSLAMYASVGKVGIIRQDTATSQAFYNMVFDNEALRDFVFTRLEKAETDSEWEPYISTGTQRNLNADKVKSFSLDVPSNEEASEISAYFANLDTLITLHQREPPHTMKEGKNANRYQWRIAFLRLLLAMD